MNCKFCNQPVTDTTIQPPLCEKHLELAIISEFLAETGEEMTVERVQTLVEGCRQRNGQMSLEPGEVRELMEKDFARRYVAK